MSEKISKADRKHEAAASAGEEPSAEVPRAAEAPGHAPDSAPEAPSPVKGESVAATASTSPRVKSSPKVKKGEKAKATVAPGAAPALPPAAPVASGADIDPGPPVKPPAPAVAPPSPDVTLGAESSALPGAHRGGFQRLPTAPVPLTSESAPAEPGTEVTAEPVAQWLMPEPSAPRRGLAGWALAFSIAGLACSLFVGWAFPIGLVGVVSAILALRRPLESRRMAVWALVLGAVSVLYSAGWLVYAASQANLFG